MYGHSISVYAEFEDRVDLNLAEQKLSQAEAISYSANTFTTPLDLGSSNESHVSRLRHGGDEYSLAFWNVAHNIRLGAATNAVKIMLKHAGYEA
jgi:aspartate-semialdehyde dehydrogenase